MRIRGRNLRDQCILILRKREAVQVHAFAFPLIDKHDGHVGRFRQSSGGSRIGAGIKLNVGRTELLR